MGDAKEKVEETRAVVGVKFLQNFKAGPRHFLPGEYVAKEELPDLVALASEPHAAVTAEGPVMKLVYEGDADVPKPPEKKASRKSSKKGSGSEDSD